MKKLLTCITFLLVTCAVQAANLWHLSTEKSIATNGEQKLFPTKYKLAKLDVQSFNLLQAKITKNLTSGIQIELPDPNGDMQTFAIADAPIMEAGLADRYPMIRTYTLVHTQNPTITAKADFTLWGFHAKVFNGKETYFIDPYRQGNKNWYMVYFKKDYQRPLNQRMQCLVEEDHDELHQGGIILNQELPKLKLSRKTFGTEKRTYRLALACTMEYAAAVGGINPTKASVLSAMITTMNRVNGVFEREFSMKCQLINNTDDVIYLPGGTDPYTNNNGGTMLGENHSTMISVLGSSNYDIGHVFSTGGGGIASFASVCRNSKARGVTGAFNPVGDPFDIDYVAHEMGHQFGGSHTFNSSIGSCNGNGSSSSAYEPGSGTTIMGYAGLCGSDNVQPNSDDYYHIRSLLQMSFHMEGIGNCASKVTLSNSPPNLSNINQTYVIPYKTFFELEASATDPDNDPITYCWEEWDLGAYGPWSTVSTGNPLFRSFYPAETNLRMFPQLLKVRPEFIKTRGEVLPEVSRDVNFKLAVRDIQNGNGSFNVSDQELKIQAVNTGTSLFRVLSQSSGSPSYTGDTKATINWEVAGTTGLGINAATVDIYFSTDTGRTFPHLMAANTPNDGTQEVVIPNVATIYGLVKVKGHNNVFFDVNDSYITVTPQVYPANVQDQELAAIAIYPNPAQDFVQISDLPKRVTNIKIASINGRVFINKDAAEKVSVAHLSNGLYFMTFVTSDQNRIVKKFVIQR